MPDEINGKVVLILGGAGGIGSATARTLASRGAQVVSGDIDGATLDEVTQSLRQDGVPVTGRRVDVTDPAALPVFPRQRSGHVVTVRSVHGLKVTPGSPAHSATKFAVHVFSEGLRSELAPNGVRVTTVVP